MRKSARSIIAIFVLAIMFVAQVAYAKISIPKATKNFYVNDYAEVFSLSEEQQLMEKAVALSDEYDGIQVVVTTIKSLDGNSIKAYSLEMYNQYGIGKNDMGLLILLSTNDRLIRVEVGKSMETYFSDSKVKRFIDKYAYPYLKENNFSKGLINLQDALIDETIACIQTKKENVDKSDRGTVTNSNIAIPSTNRPPISYNTEMYNDRPITLHDTETYNDRPTTSQNNELVRFLSIIIIAIAFVVIVCVINAKVEARKKVIEDYISEIERLKEKVAGIKQADSNMMESLKRDNSKLSEKNHNLERLNQNLQNTINALREQYARVKKLYPNIDSEINAMIEEEIRQKDIDKAKNVDSIIGQVINLSPSKDIVSRLSNAISSYESLTTNQRSFVQSDIAELEALYNISLRLKREHDQKVREENNRKRAEKAAANITDIISLISFGSAMSYPRLKDAKSIYDSLDSDARRYFDPSVLSKLNGLYERAEYDYQEEERRREEEERRKRAEEERRRAEEERRRAEERRREAEEQRRRNSSSHYGGYGGVSRGGGASRSF